MHDLAPIILFVYNRPEHTRKTVEALKKNELASESVLYVFADGAKSGSTEEQLKKVKGVQDYVNAISGFKEIHVEKSEKNKGLANSVIAGVTRIVEQYGKIIVVEDDIVTHPFFLRYMNECLDVYKDRQDIFMIGGFSNNIKFPWWYKKDIYVLYRSCSWGWATWRDRWSLADWKVSDFQQMCHNKKLQEKFNRGGDDMFPMLQAQIEGKIDSWAIRWDYCMYKHNALCVRPVKTLCVNAGMDGSGVHCSTTERVLNAPLYPKNAPYRFNLVKNISISCIIAKRFKDFNSPPKENVVNRYYVLSRHYIHITRLKIWEKIGIK